MRQQPSRAARLRAERGARRTLRGALAGGALAALALGAAFASPIAGALPTPIPTATSTAATPASPAPTGSATAAPVASPRPTVVTGDGTITATWSAVAGATGYTLRVSTTKSLTHARRIMTTETTAVVPRLKNGITYWVAVDTVVGGATGHGSPVKAVPQAGAPVAIGRVAVVPGPLENQVTVSWTGGARQLKVAVVAGSDVLVSQRAFHSAWYPATTRSITLTVPTAARAYIGAGTGNPVWIRVAQSNSASTAFGTRWNAATKLRTSPIGQWAFAKAIVPAAATSRITVAELNTQSYGSTAGFAKIDQWHARAPRLAAYIETAKADVLTTAELATNVVDGCANTMQSPYRCASHTQVGGLAARLHGLRLADTDAYARVMDQQRGFGGRWAGKVTDGAHVFFNPATLTVLSHGYFSPALTPAQSFADVTGLGVEHWSGSGAVGPDRWLSWAELQTKDGSGRRFYAVAAHFPVGSGALVTSVRAEEARKAIAAIDAIAGTTPVVFGGDFNSDAVRSPKAVHTAFMTDGWFDAGAVASKAARVNMRVSTTNDTGVQDGAAPGYGSRPNWMKYPTARIDYIVMRNSPYTYGYENVLRLNAAGGFIKSMQGTDHNMQVARIGIASPATPAQ